MTSGGTDQNYGILNALWLGDSIPYGVDSDVICGYREPIFYKAIQENKPIRFVGPLQFAGGHLSLSRDPWMACVPGQVLNPDGISFAVYAGPYLADMVIQAEGTNDIARGDSAATVLASISAALDALWANRTSAKFRIVWFAILKRLDALDSVVQAVNAGVPAVIASKTYAANVTFASGVYSAIVRAVVGQGYFDPVHPNDEGYQNIADVAWPYIRTALGQFLS